MSSELDLITKILETQDLAEVIDAGITPKFFLDPDRRVEYRMVLEHQAKYGKVPSLDVFKKDYPNFDAPKVREPISYYIDQIQEGYRYYLVETGLGDAFDLYDEGDIQGVIERMATMLQEVNIDSSKTRVTDITQTGTRRIKRYKAYGKTDESLRGIPTGFAFLDKVTLGWQRKQLVTFVGPPAAGKSTMLLLSSLAAHQAVYKPLFIGFEMTNEEQEERHDAIRSGIPHAKIRSGSLSKKDYAQLEKMMGRSELLPPMLFSEDSNYTLTVSGVAAQIDRYEPDIVFIDGTYMMDDENGEPKGSSQALTNITRSLKKLAKNQDICVVNTTQVLLSKMIKQKIITLHSVGYTSSFGQDSDELIAVENTDDPTIKKLKSLKARSHGSPEAYIMWDWETGVFKQLEGVPDEEKDSPVSF